MKDRLAKAGIDITKDNGNILMALLKRYKMIIEVKLPFEVESKELAAFFKYNAKKLHS